VLIILPLLFLAIYRHFSFGRSINLMHPSPHCQEGKAKSPQFFSLTASRKRKKKYPESPFLVNRNPAIHDKKNHKDSFET